MANCQCQYSDFDSIYGQPLQIMDVDQEKGVLTTLLWLDLSWDDDYLRWVRARFQASRARVQVRIEYTNTWNSLAAAKHAIRSFMRTTTTTFYSYQLLING